MEEKRKFHRIAYQADGVIRREQKPEIKITVSDLSIHGALLCTSNTVDITIGESCEVSITLCEDLAISFKAQVTRVENNQNTSSTAIGVQCTSISVEDITSMKTLIAMNSSEPYLLERELSELIR